MQIPVKSVELLNLVRNGFEAMPEPGVVEISTYAKDNVVMEVKDSGHGIPREIIDKLGTPFLQPRKWHGLGLYTAFRILDNYLHMRGKVISCWNRV